MADDTDYIIELHRGMGQLEGQVKALTSAVETGFKQVRADQAVGMSETRKANSEQWMAIEKNREDCADKKDGLIKDCADHRVKQATKTVITGGASGGGLMLMWEIIKHYFKGGG